MVNHSIVAIFEISTKFKDIYWPGASLSIECLVDSFFNIYISVSCMITSSDATKSTKTTTAIAKRAIWGFLQSGFEWILEFCWPVEQLFTIQIYFSCICVPVSLFHNTAGRTNLERLRGKREICCWCFLICDFQCGKTRITSRCHIMSAHNGFYRYV